MKGLGIAAAALLVLAATEAGAQGGNVGAGSSGSMGSGTTSTGPNVGGGTISGSGDRTDQPVTSVPPVREPALRGVEPRSALGESRFTNRVDDPLRGDRGNAMPPGGDRPLRTETEHDRTGMRPAQTPGQAPAR